MKARRVPGGLSSWTDRLSAAFPWRGWPKINAMSGRFMILTPFWSQGIGTEAVRQICGIAFRELALERIIGEVFPENLASARVLEKNGFRLEETKVGVVVKGGKAMDVKVFTQFGRKI